MYTVWDIYKIFRKVQAEVNNRGYRLPKDWSYHWNNKFTKTQRENLQNITNYFNTKWQDIDPHRYFEAGFEVLKNFSYHSFFNKKVLEMYKRRDKLDKRKLEINKEKIVNNIKYVLKEIENDERRDKLGPLRTYCRIRDGEMSKPVKDYINNKIDTPFLTWLIYERYLVLTETEKSLIPLVINNYRDLVAEIRSIENFLNSLKNKLTNK